MYLALTVRDVIKPAVDPPPGVISNFDNPASRGQGVIVAGVVLLLLSLLFVSIRLYTRIWVTRALGWDDYTCAAAWIVSFGFTITQTLETKYGLGVHAWDLPYSTYHNGFLKLRIAGFSLYWVQACLVKVSILLLYLRIFTVSYGFRITIWATAFITVGYSLAGFVGTLALCRPAKGYCLNLINMSLTSSAFNIATDLIIFFIPLPQIFRLQMSRKQKIGLAFTFSVGFLEFYLRSTEAYRGGLFNSICIVSSLRLYYYTKGIGNRDITWAVADAIIWTFIEGSLMICCACMPAIPAFVRYHKTSGLSSYWSKLTKRTTTSSSQRTRSLPFTSGTAKSGERGITVNTTLTSSEEPSPHTNTKRKAVPDSFSSEGEAYAEYVELEKNPTTSTRTSRSHLVASPR